MSRYSRLTLVGGPGCRGGRSRWGTLGLLVPQKDRPEEAQGPSSESWPHRPRATGP